MKLLSAKVCIETIHSLSVLFQIPRSKMAADQQIHILNNDKGSLTESADLKLDEVEKNIRVLITKLKGSHMNEGTYLLIKKRHY